MDYFDYTWIQIPLLGLEFDPPRYFALGDFRIYFYGLLIAVGLMLAVVYGCKRCAQFGIREDDLTDGILWVVPFAIICARLYYVIFKWEDYAADPITALYIWKGGLAIYGGVIGAFVGTVVHCLVKKIKIPALLDLVVLGLLIGQCIGRWGNFFNREAFGAETDAFIRMGLWNTATGEWEYHHPTFLYESLWNGLGFLLLHFCSKHRKYDGQIALSYLAWYGLGRAIIEGLRTDSLYWGVFRVSQLLAAVSCFVGVLILLIQWLRPHDPEKLYVRQVAARAAAEEVAEEIEEAEPIEIPEPPAETDAADET